MPRVDKDGKKIKYESPIGQRNQAYFPPGVAEVIPDVSRELIFTEGEFKALAATQHGFPCIGLVGVFGWKCKQSESMLPELERIPLRGRRMFIAYDSDILENEFVQQAESRLAAHFANRGAIVKVVRIPAGPPDAAGKPTKYGLDDYLAVQADPKKAMRELLDKAEEPPPPDSIIVKEAGCAIDSTIEGPAFVESTKIDGLPRLRFHRCTWLYYQGGAYRQHQPAEVRARLVAYLMRNYFKIAQSHTSNVLDVVKSVSILPFSTEAPEWIGDKPGPWPADELLVAKNGIFHLPTVAAYKEPCSIPLTPSLFVENALDYNLDMKAPLPEAWFRFLYELWGEDVESINMLQEWAGYLLTADTSQQKICMLVGPKRSGKGTIVRVLRSLIGAKNVCGPTLSSMASHFGLWPLLGKSLAVVNDARLSRRTDTAVVVEPAVNQRGRCHRH